MPIFYVNGQGFVGKRYFEWLMSVTLCVVNPNIIHNSACSVFCDILNKEKNPKDDLDSLNIYKKLKPRNFD